MTFKERRLKAENDWCKLVGAFDKSDYNANRYRRIFAKLSDREFTKYMKRISSGEEYIQFEINSSNEDYKLDEIFDICRKLKLDTHKHIIYRDGKNTDSGDVVSPEKCLILMVPMRRLQQMLDSKNTSSSNIDTVNPIVGTVTGNSKAAAMNDTQIIGLITNGQTNAAKEFLGPRADDEIAKFQMLNQIEENGDVKLADLTMNGGQKQSSETFRVFMRSVGLKVTQK